MTVDHHINTHCCIPHGPPPELPCGRLSLTLVVFEYRSDKTLLEIGRSIGSAMCASLGSFPTSGSHMRELTGRTGMMRPPEDAKSGFIRLDGIQCARNRWFGETLSLGTCDAIAQSFRIPIAFTYISGEDRGASGSG